MSDIYRDSIFWVEIERIKANPFQPRREFNQEKLEGLAESIRMYGLLQPLTVTRNEKSKEDGGIFVEYELIAGERRLRASKIAGLTQIPVIIRSGEDTDQMKLELAIIENLQREDLNPVDRAKAFYRLHKDFRFTHNDIGKKVGKSREYVTNSLRLLSLPEEVQRHLADGRIVEGHTRPLLMLNDKPEEQQVLVKEIMLKSLTVREAETLARRAAQDRVSPKYKINPEILNLERQLTEKLGTRVQIEQREKGGKVVISFFSPEDLNTLLDTMRYQGEKDGLAKAFESNESSKDNQEGSEEREEKLQDTPVAEEQSTVVEEFVTIESPEAIAEESEEQKTENIAQEQEVEQEMNSESSEKEVQDSSMESIKEKRGEEGELPSMANRFKDFLTGHSLVQEEHEAQTSQHETPKEAASEAPIETPTEAVIAVEPSPDRPLPEDKIVNPETNPETEPKKEEQKTEDEEDLYSIRNFSI